MATFASFRQAAGRWAHVLNTFESVCHVALGQTDQAIERLLAALAVNPLLVGAYKDLGDLFMRDYQMRLVFTGPSAGCCCGTMNHFHGLGQALAETEANFFSSAVM